jgi:hypothetical protein
MNNKAHGNIVYRLVLHYLFYNNHSWKSIVLNRLRRFDDRFLFELVSFAKEDQHAIQKNQKHSHLTS